MSVYKYICMYIWHMLSQLWKRMRALVVMRAADKDKKKKTHEAGSPVEDY